MYTTRLTQEQMNLYTSVKDQHLNDLFQDINKKYKNLFLLKEHFEVKKSWLNGESKTVRYTLFSKSEGNEVIHLPFGPETYFSPNNKGVDSDYIYAYFYGLRTGYGAFNNPDQEAATV